jgi:hypothetical protein
VCLLQGSITEGGKRHRDHSVKVLSWQLLKGPLLCQAWQGVLSQPCWPAAVSTSSLHLEHSRTTNMWELVL